MSEDVLLNYGITRPTPLKAKMNDYSIDFTPLFYKLQGDLFDDRNQRILKNIYRYLYPDADVLSQREFITIDENGNLMVKIGKYLERPIQEVIDERRPIDLDTEIEIRNLIVELDDIMRRNFSSERILSRADNVFTVIKNIMTS